MKTFIYILLLFIISSGIHSQSLCDPSLNSNIPPSPYIDGYLTFDGTGDFLRSSDLNGMEFPSNTTDSFSILSSIKVTLPYTPMYILGKWRIAGWMLGYNNSETGYLSIYINNEWKRIYFLGADTTWHNYEIRYSKADLKLTTLVDGEITNTYNGFTYSNMADNCAFSVGNVGFLPQYGPESVNLSSMWFKGSISSIKVKANNNIIVNYGFNEGSGQVARDSAGYYYTDRTYPGSSTCGLSHLMLGYMQAEDTCDPVWSSFDSPVQSRFTPLGSGTRYWYDGPAGQFYSEHFSTCMTTWNGNLINAGFFNLAGGNAANFIAAWDGSQWTNLGSGLNHEPLGLGTFRGELYTTGFFDSAGGDAAKYIAKWDGFSWQPLGSGLNNIGNVMLEFNNELIVGGWFTSAGGEITPSVAKWDGTNWHSMSIGMSGPVYALSVYNGELYAGGNFYTASGQSCNGIARWDGYKWNPVGTGIAGGDKVIFTLSVYNGELYAGGSFIKMDNIYCYNIAKYNGSTWSATGLGATGTNCSISQGFVAALKSFNGELYAAGMFTKLNGETANKLAKYNGRNWCQVEYGVDLRPRAFEIYNNELIINGDFYSASGVNCNNIVSYNPPKILTGTENNSVPVKFSLEQNYPNPFNPKTKIKYSISNNQPGNVKLTVYDIAGKVSGVLVNKQQTAGNYEIDFDGSDLASGVYIYRLETTGANGLNMSESKKMILIK